MRKISFDEAIRRYNGRYTMEHIPAWARQTHNGRYYAPQFRSDREWYDNTKFPGEPGHIGDRNHCCTSDQTWPLGQWLDAPFQPL
jgi:hypothetical protein